MKRARKAQEEIVGFVLIIVLVAVIVVVFLGLGIRRSSGVEKSKDVENFLHSYLLFTSSCQETLEEKIDMKDLIIGCYNNRVCLSGEGFCEALNRTSVELIEASFQVGEENKYKAYEFRIQEDNETLLLLTKGNLTFNKVGSEVFVLTSWKNMDISLKLYY